MNQDDEIIEAEVIDEIEDRLAESGACEPGEEVEPVDFFPDSLPLSGVAALRQGLMLLDDQRQALAAKGDIDSLAYGSADLAVIIGDLQTLNRSTRLDIAKLMLAAHEGKRGNPKHEVPGLGIIDVPGGHEWRDWESERLLRKLMTDAITEDGELRHFDHPSEVVDRVYEVLVACLPVTASLGWRVGKFDKATEEWTGLRGAGIDPEDYANHAEKERLAQVPKRQEAGA